MNKIILIGFTLLFFIITSLFISSVINSDKNTRTTTVGIPKEQTIFVPEGYRRLEDYSIVIDVAILPAQLNGFWVIYGTEADTLEFKTPTVSNELGMGTAGEYGWYSISIPHEALQPGISYFYRVVGETTEGEILYSGLNRFTAGK